MNEVTILAIDDEEDIRFALAAVMESEGWNTILAANVKDGIKALRENAPDLILIDYHMPEINGLEGVAMIKEYCPDTPIIVFTIDDSQELADKFIEAGAIDFAIKPIRAPDIISRIKIHIRLLNKHTSQPKEIKHSNTKGIGVSTLNLISEAMLKNEEYLTVEEISHNSGLAYQTTYRYLQYMALENMILVKTSYGKIGRPKQTYKINK